MTGAEPAFLWVVRDRHSPGGVSQVVQQLDSGLSSLGVESRILAWDAGFGSTGTARSSWVTDKLRNRRRRRRAAAAFAVTLRAELRADPRLIAVLEPGSIEVARYLRGSPRWGLHVHWNPDLLLHPRQHLTGETIPWALRPAAMLQAYVQGLTQRAIVRAAPFLVSLSPSQTEVLRALNSNVVEIANPLSVRPRPRTPRNPVMPPRVTYLGRLSYEKGPDVFLDALAILARRGVRLSAVIAGDGPMGTWVRTRLADESLAHVRGLGWVGDPASLLAQTDVFVLSSRVEAVPLVLVEALASGCDIVATDAGGGVRDLLGDGRFGQIVPASDPELLASAIAATATGSWAVDGSDRQGIEGLVRAHEPGRIVAQWVELATAATSRSTRSL